MNASASLIISVYNRQSFLPTAIESVLAQTHPDFELLIWDDGSTDDSVAIAQRYAEQDDRIRVVAAPHQGFAPALKSAILQSTGRYLGWVDSDDALAPTALAETIALLDAHPTVGMVYTDYEVINESGKVLGLGSRCQTPYSKDRLLVEFMTFHFRLLRRSVYDQIGGLDSSYERAEDYDLCLRLSEVTDVLHLARSLYYHRRHAENMTNDQLEQIRWAYQASTQALRRRGLDADYKIDLRSQFALMRK